MSLKTSSDTLNVSGCMLTYITDTKAAECFRAKPFRHGRQRQDSEEMGGGRYKEKGGADKENEQDGGAQ